MKQKKSSKKPPRPRKTKILAIGDIHSDQTLIKKLANKAKKEKVDLVILAGDLTFAELSTKNIIGPFAKAGKEVLIIPGNHESVSTINFLTEMYSNAKSIHGYYVIKNNIGIFGAGGGDIGIYRVGEDELYNLLERGKRGLDKSKIKKRIMVTHLQPANTTIEKIGGFRGSTGIRKAIEKFQPNIALCSHLHSTGGIEEKIGKTRLISVSRKEKIFEI